MILCAARDLRHDVRAMREKRCKRAHILAVRAWHTVSTIVPVVWDGFVRVMKNALLMPGWIKQIRGPGQ